MENENLKTHLETKSEKEKGERDKLVKEIKDIQAEINFYNNATLQTKLTDLESCLETSKMTSAKLNREVSESNIKKRSGENQL